MVNNKWQMVKLVLVTNDTNLYEGMLFVCFVSFVVGSFSVSRLVKMAGWWVWWSLTKRLSQCRG